MSTATQDERTSEDQTAQTSSNAVQLGEGLQALHSEIIEQLAEIETEGEQVKLAVGHAMLASDVNAEMAGELQGELIEVLAEKHETHEEVSISEITLALWAELNRVARMGTGENTSDDRGDESLNNGGAQTEAKSNRLGDQTTENPSENSSKSAIDPAFQ